MRLIEFCTQLISYWLLIVQNAAYHLYALSRLFSFLFLYTVDRLLFAFGAKIGSGMQYDSHTANDLFEKLFDGIQVMRRLTILYFLLILVQLLLKAMRQLLILPGKGPYLFLINFLNSHKSIFLFLDLNNFLL